MDKNSGKNKVGEKNSPTHEDSPTSIHPPISTGNPKLKKLEKAKLLVLQQLFNEGKLTNSIRRIGLNAMLDPSTVRFHLRSLLTMGLVEHDETCVHAKWFVSKKGIETLNQVGEKTLVVYEREWGSITGEDSQDTYKGYQKFQTKPRSHFVQIKVKVTQKPESKAWLNGWRVNDKMKNNSFCSRKFGDIIVTYTGTSCMFRMPELNLPTSDDAIHLSLQQVETLCKELERDIEGLKLGEKTVTCSLVSQHHAMVGHPLAQIMVKNGHTYRDEVLHVDASTGKDKAETEAVDNNFGAIHADRGIAHTKDVMVNELPLPSDLTKMVHYNQRNIQELANYQKTLMEAMTNTSKEIQNLTILNKMAIARMEKIEEEDRNGSWRKWL